MKVTGYLQYRRHSHSGWYRLVLWWVRKPNTLLKRIFGPSPLLEAPSDCSVCNVSSLTRNRKFFPFRKFSLLGRLDLKHSFFFDKWRPFIISYTKIVWYFFFAFWHWFQVTTDPHFTFHFLTCFSTFQGCQLENQQIKRIYWMWCPGMRVELKSGAEFLSGIFFYPVMY